METLLRYALTEVTLVILMVELIIILICSAIVIWLRISNKRKERENEEQKKELSKLMMHTLVEPKSLKSFKIPWRLRDFKNMIQTLESFNQRLTDPIWVEIKNKVIDHYLLQKAKRSVHSLSWMKRQLAARTFLLSPEKAPEKHLALLLQDSKFLVRVIAAVCITQTSHRELFYKVIQKMSQETPLSRFSYRDALIQVDSEKFKWIEDLLRKEANNPAIATICLDLLSTRTTHNLIPLLVSFIYGQNRECRLLAVKVLKNISSPDSVEILMYCLDDADWEIRAEAIKGLANLHATKAVSRIQALLNDPNWFVRLQAALALKKFGSEGLAILSNQDLTTTPLAHEIAQYVLALPE